MEDIFRKLLILDLTLFTSLIIYFFIPKDEINPILGYRTKRSMKSTQNWKFAQSYFSKKWLYSIPLMLATQLPILFNRELPYILEISFVNFVIYTIYLIVIVEKKLKQLDEKTSNNE